MFLLSLSLTLPLLPTCHTPRFFPYLSPLLHVYAWAALEGLGWCYDSHANLASAANRVPRAERALREAEASLANLQRAHGTPDALEVRRP